MNYSIELRLLTDQIQEQTSNSIDEQDTFSKQWTFDFSVGTLNSIQSLPLTEHYLSMNQGNNPKCLFLRKTGWLTEAYDHRHFRTIYLCELRFIYAKLFSTSYKTNEIRNNVGTKRLRDTRSSLCYLKLNSSNRNSS